mmetsp:Transcript_10333/g.20820  ORF Transcript_10333/g.20820 Transcript_10333/m.20820 type:complete len:235 (+) Transcript_10333:2191-2895(+)
MKHSLDVAIRTRSTRLTFPGSIQQGNDWIDVNMCRIQEDFPDGEKIFLIHRRISHNWAACSNEGSMLVGFKRRGFSKRHASHLQDFADQAIPIGMCPRRGDPDEDVTSGLDASTIELVASANPSQCSATHIKLLNHVWKGCCFASTEGDASGVTCPSKRSPQRSMHLWVWTRGGHIIDKCQGLSSYAKQVIHIHSDAIHPHALVGTHLCSQHQFGPHAICTQGQQGIITKLNQP